MNKMETELPITKQEDSIKLIKNTKGYGWELKLVGDLNEDQIVRLEIFNKQMVEMLRNAAANGSTLDAAQVEEDVCIKEMPKGFSGIKRSPPRPHKVNQLSPETVEALRKATAEGATLDGRDYRGPSTSCYTGRDMQEGPKLYKGFTPEHIISA